MEEPRGPLAGIRIVEIDAIGPVPLAAMLLADMGADIVRVARPPSAGVGDWEDVGGDILHRSRAVVHLDLKQDADRARLLDLVERADGLIEGYRPGVMERLGVGPDACLARNPRLVFARMTGWGQTGPLALRAGHDINYLAITGALHAMGEKGSPPPVPLNLVGDYGGGAMFLIAGMLSALLSAQRTGRGQVVDACITDGVASLMSLFYAWQPKGLWEDAPGSNLLDGAAPFYRTYACADGGHVAVGCLEPKFFAQMVEGLGLADRGYDQNARAGWPAMEADFAAAFASRPRDEWAALFAATDACVTPVLSMAEAPSHPHNRARGTFVERNAIAQPAPAPRLSNTPAAIREPGALTIGDAINAWS
ncbi:CaiB/BaiF CoA transferase family protein [Novosphingobium sp. BL-52-GroH]|uniref:CaiB/BaiF CoA transferase family protein n=1 Tax=Novosphingobium sp. BL-52-GroH TaxID=3349877 RepID=UPI00384D1F7B